MTLRIWHPSENAVHQLQITFLPLASTVKYYCSTEPIQSQDLKQDLEPSNPENNLSELAFRCRDTPLICLTILYDLLIPLNNSRRSLFILSKFSNRQASLWINNFTSLPTPQPSATSALAFSIYHYHDSKAIDDQCLCSSHMLCLPMVPVSTSP